MKLSAKIAAFEIEGDEVRAAVVRTGGKTPVVLETHAQRVPSAGPEGRRAALVQTTREILGRIKGRPQLYVLSVGCQHAIVRALNIPFRGRSKVSAAVAFELEPYLAVPVEDLAVDHGVIREIDGETEVLAVGVRHSLLEEQTSVLAEAGVLVEGISLDVAGLTSLWLGGRRAVTGLHALLHVRETACVLTIVYNRSIAYIRPLPIGAKSMRENPQAVSREVRNSLRAFLANWRGESSIAELTVTDAELSPAERDAFEEGMQIPLVYESLSDGLKGAEHLGQEGIPAGEAPSGTDETEALQANTRICPNYWEAAVGVAAAAAGSGVSFEFRKGTLASAGTARGMTLHFVFSACLLLLVLAGAVGYCVLDYRRNMEEIKRCGDEIWAIYTKTFPDAESAKERLEKTDIGGIQTAQFMEEAKNAAVSQGTTLQLDVLSRPTLLEILKEISAKLPGDKIRVTEISVPDSRSSNQAVVIKGEVNDPQALNDAFAQLKSSTILKVDEEPLRQTKRDKTAFTINAMI
ncbi:MAG: hypothetical protein IT365_18510 [Candidatus Hydrogenedentes bacterium]|nr:hypothetical protein [Candidatus Hydrogenedentota bacterium]